MIVSHLTEGGQSLAFYTIDYVAGKMKLTQDQVIENLDELKPSGTYRTAAQKLGEPLRLHRRVLVMPTWFSELHGLLWECEGFDHWYTRFAAKGDVDDLIRSVTSGGAR